MRDFKFYFTENEIIRQVCKIRIKSAKSKSKKHLLHLLTSNSKYNYHQQLTKPPTNEFEAYQIELMQNLSDILPSRKNWSRLGENSRRKSNKTNEFLTSNDKNFYSLLKTIKVHKKKDSQEEWFLNLQKFIIDIQSLVNNIDYKVKKPIIFPKLKDPIKRIGVNECRPICIFSLKDRIVLSLTNKFLTQLFDNFFQDSSYAFRAKKNENNKTLSHHDCIKDILKFKKINLKQDLFVVECDMKKFYDTVNQTIAKSLFDELIAKSIIEYPDISLDSPIRIFESYLNCFAFNFDIPKPSNENYWNSYKISNGEFSWVENIITENYTHILETRIGVPQGGALSGLIANIYLNPADIELTKTKVLYQRFCDDMIIIHNDHNECEKAKNIYVQKLKELKLFPHPFKTEEELILVEQNLNKHKLFWTGKSKGPYKWAEINNDGFPWIGFVGYEIYFNADVRIRKKSLEKELKKQNKIIQEIKNAISSEMRKPKGSATESAINRLIGMSVGRIGLDNFEEVSTDLCWKNGFKELTLNSHSLRQIKKLDRNRNKQYYKFLKNIEEPELEKKGTDDRQIVKYNKPFSYYYQILEREKKQTTNPK